MKRIERILSGMRSIRMSQEFKKNPILQDFAWLLDRFDVLSISAGCVVANQKDELAMKTLFKALGCLDEPAP